MKILSWNVNGLRAVAKKGFLDWFQQEQADIVCLQEVKAVENQVDIILSRPQGYYSVWHQGNPGYAGVLTYSKRKLLNAKNTFDESCFYEDGRMIETEFDDFILLNIYFPNGGAKVHKGEQLTYKLNFYKKLQIYLEEIKRRQKNIIICGDFNIAHTEIDIARPEENKDSIGFLPIERETFSQFLDSGFIDVFRYFNKEKKDSYTWWSYRTRARERNIGWRIDYFLVSPNLISKVKKIEHQTHIIGSDHCPLVLEIN